MAQFIIYYKKNNAIIITPFNQAKLESGYQIFNCSNCEAKSSAVKFLNACSKLFGLAGAFAASPFCFFVSRPWDATFVCDLDVLLGVEPLDLLELVFDLDGDIFSLPARPLIILWY